MISERGGGKNDFQCNTVYRPLVLGKMQPGGDDLFDPPRTKKLLLIEWLTYLDVVEELVHGTLQLGGERLVGRLVGHPRVNVEVPAHNGEVCRGALHQVHHLLCLAKNK